MPHAKAAVHESAAAVVAEATARASAAAAAVGADLEQERHLAEQRASRGLLRPATPAAEEAMARAAEASARTRVAWGSPTHPQRPGQSPNQSNPSGAPEVLRVNHGRSPPRHPPPPPRPRTSAGRAEAAALVGDDAGMLEAMPAVITFPLTAAVSSMSRVGPRSRRANPNVAGRNIAQGLAVRGTGRRGGAGAGGVHRDFKVWMDRSCISVLKLTLKIFTRLPRVETGSCAVPSLILTSFVSI